MKESTKSESVDANNQVLYAIWRMSAWLDNQGTYSEIDAKVISGELVPIWPYKSPDDNQSL